MVLGVRAPCFGWAPAAAIGCCCVLATLNSHKTLTLVSHIRPRQCHKHEGAATRKPAKSLLKRRRASLIPAGRCVHVLAIPLAFLSANPGRPLVLSTHSTVSAVHTRLIIEYTVLRGTGRCSWLQHVHSYSLRPIHTPKSSGTSRVWSSAHPCHDEHHQEVRQVQTMDRREGWCEQGQDRAVGAVQGHGG